MKKSSKGLSGIAVLVVKSIAKVYRWSAFLNSLKIKSSYTVDECKKGEWVVETIFEGLKNAAEFETELFSLAGSGRNCHIDYDN